MKERLTGAIILVALIVLLVPELLTGPIRTKSAPAASATPAAVPLRSYTLTLSAPRSADAAPATPAAQAPAQPTPAAGESPPESSARAPGDSAAEDGGTQQHAPAPEAPTPPAQAPSVSRQSAGTDPDLQVASPPAHPAVHEAHLEASSGGWVVQLGSFASHQNANRLARSLGKKGFRMSVSPARAGARVLWRVRAGPAHDRAAALRLAARLRALGHRGELLPVR